MKFSDLSASERRLVSIVAALFFVLLNVVVVKYFISTRAQLVQQSVQKTELCASLRLLNESSALWEERAQWLQKTQPKLEVEQVEGNALLTLLKESASKNGVSLSKQQLASARNDSVSLAVPVECELKASWKNLCGFLADLQAPEKFVVIQQSRLRIDPTDATQMLCTLTVAKWFAPK